ncbi:hypothetical protein KFK09_012024 [Dendrobium nobile]|uniref:Uncharacterized protein n=1 Tax=Dendrobium nobile TaxID=94219 RepID=A0A8T3BG63_DENNO|nr:hypothetical protein KFK09_012024 [Dendrobium nobile]
MRRREESKGMGGRTRKTAKRKTWGILGFREGQARRFCGVREEERGGEREDMESWDKRERKREGVKIINSGEEWNLWLQTQIR